MYPYLFTVPGTDFAVSNFGVMMSLGFLAAYFITAKRMAELKLDPEWASTLLLYALIGGALGAKIYFTIDVGLRENIPFAQLLFARDGLTWYGGLMGGILAAAIACKVHGVSFRVTSNAAAVGCAIGQSLGRVGCFLVGDDYGVPTDLPWGVAFPNGIQPTVDTVHPTQLYEVLWLVPVAALLWSRRDKSPSLFGEYLIANGLGRLVIEMLRINPKVALGMTEPQWIGIALIASGSILWFYYRSQAAAEPQRT